MYIHEAKFFEVGAGILADEGLDTEYYLVCENLETRGVTEQVSWKTMEECVP